MYVMVLCMYRRMDVVIVYVSIMVVVEMRPGRLVGKGRLVGYTYMGRSRTGGDRVGGRPSR